MLASHLARQASYHAFAMALIMLSIAYVLPDHCSRCPTIYSCRCAALQVQRPQHHNTFGITL